MKKLTFITFLCLATVSANAQLKVHGTGQVSVATTILPSNNAKLSVGDTTNIASGESINLHSAIGYATSQANVAVNGLVLSGSSTGATIGVRGRARGGNYGRCYGVLGSLHPSDYGTGILGAVDYPQGIPIYGKYAGYFCGEVYSTGTMRAPSFVTTSDRQLKENITSFKETEKTATLDNVMKMNVVEYNYKGDVFEKIVPASESEKGEEKRLHFGLLAQELQTLYPNLVYKGQDGYLGVNYQELVPVLIRSIQELKQQLDEVKDVKTDETAKARGFGGAFEEDEETTGINDATAIPATASLAQNVPNPFTERTTIRFTLPDDAKNACICIFDMSGKMLKQIPVDATMQSITIEGYELQAGMYIYSLLIDGKEIKTRRMILSK